MSVETTEKPGEGFDDSFGSCWRRLPNKAFFFILLLTWLVLFQFLGNSTLGYIHSPSLYQWMWEAYMPKPGADDSHGKLLPIVVLVLLYWKRKELLGKPLQLWLPGLAIVGAGLFLHLAGYLLQQPRGSILAFYVGIYGLTALSWGYNWLKNSFFPFFLFIFAVPLGSATDIVAFPLRLMVTKFVALICQHLLGIGVMSEGTRLFKLALPSPYEYDVAAACSGIRSLVAISAIAIIYAFMVLPSWWKRIVLIGSAIPLAVIGNTFRLLAIVIAAEMGGQEWGMKIHDNAICSMLPYIPAIVGVMLIGRWLERRPKPPVEPPPVAAQTLTIP